MGNVQTSSIANQLLPFESYISDVPELKYMQVTSLGSTRFMKVARIDHVDDSSLVVKVFVIVDQQFCIEPYREQLLHISRRLNNHPNCAPINRIHLTSRSAILCRRFYNSTLYDRLSTRPFLSNIEKRWIAFQLLKVLAQLRIAMVRHGDIKSQNVLVSSSLWVQLTDFAPFKPAFIPFNNPSKFTFFFDTSRRRYCYLAPERFKDSDELDGRYSNIEFLNFYEGLTEAMDIFSCGCVLVELMTDGRQIAFNLPQAIDYKNMDEHAAQHYLKKVLSGIGETEFRQLISVMLGRDPKRRKEEFLKMSPCASLNLFPSIFEKYLYNYFKDLQEQPTADALITKLFVERDNFLALLQVENAATNAVLFVNIVTSALRSCQSLTAKMDAISLLNQLAKLSTPSIVFERIVPYLTHCLTDHFALVRAEAIIALKDMLAANAEDVPPEECRLLIDFIFPKMKPILSDRSTAVKIALASNLGVFTRISLRFFDASVKRLRSESPEQQDSQNTSKSECVVHQASRLDKFLGEEKRLLLETERQALYDTVNEFFVTLCGSENEMRRCIFCVDNFDLICQFFGALRATDLLMHMITLLNDKHEWRIRAAFFEACPVLIKYMGQNKISKLKPFLQQGLQDTEEFVVLACLNCVHLFCERQLSTKTVMFELLHDLVPFLIHPNKWLRVAVVNILIVLEQTLSTADIYCKLTPLVRQFLREQLISLNCREVIYETLLPPISRQIWDFVARQNHSSELIASIEERRTLEKLGGGKNSLFSAISHATQHVVPVTVCKTQDKTMAVEMLMRKLSNMGLDEEGEDKLLAFKHMLARMNKLRKTDSGPDKYSELARIRLHELNRVKRKVFDLESGIHRPTNSEDISQSSTQFYIDNFGAQHLFNASELIEPAQICDLSENQMRADLRIDDSSSARILLEETLRHKQKRYCDQRRITTSSGEANCRVVERIAAALELTEGSSYTNGTTSRSMAASTGGIKNSCPESKERWRARRPNIRMLAHLHEHAGKVTRMAKHPDQGYFASSSMDRSVKIWSSASLLDNTQPAATSLDTLRYSHPVNACGFMGDRGAHLVMACADASLQMFDIERKHLLKSVKLDSEAEGQVSDLYCIESLIYALTHHSTVLCYDLRIAPKKGRNAIELSSVWQRRVRNSYGLITSFCVDSVNQHWMLLTASSATTKNMLLWDLRPLPNGSRCHRAVTNCTREAELSLWDLSTQSRTDVFWPSTEAPLTYKTETVSTAVAPSAIEEDIVFTGDTEGSLRCWNLRNPNASSYLCGPFRKYLPTNDLNVSELQQLKSRMVYRQVKIKDSVLRVQIEDRSQLLAADRQSDDKSIAQQSPEAHSDGITDLLSFWPDLLISSGREGVIKMWKVS